MNKLMLIDGNSILNRAFYGLSGKNMLMTAKGVYTNAIYGFLNILKKYLDEENPDFLCVAFDVRARTFRHEEYDEYKANRKGMPDELYMQMPLIKDILDAMNITRMEIEGFEGDDLIGTMSASAEEKGIECVIVTGDKDTFQLISEKTHIKYPVTKFGKTDTKEYTLERFTEEYGITPVSFIDVKGLMGDSSDNIPGVAGIGEKTALELIKRFGSIEALYDNIEDIEKPAAKAKLAAGKDMAFLSKRLATIKRDVHKDAEKPCIACIDDCKVEPYDAPKLRAIFDELEFKSMIQKFGLSDVAPSFPLPEVKNIEFADDVEIKNDFKLINDVEIICISDINGDKFKNYIEEIKKYKSVSVFARIEKASSYDSRITEISLCTSQTKSIPIYIEILKNSDEALVIDSIRDILASEEIEIYMHDAKPFITILKKYGIDIKGLKFDTMIAEYLCDPSSSDYKIQDLMNRYFNVDKSELAGDKPAIREMTLFGDFTQDKDEALKFARISKAIFDLAGLQKSKVEQNEMDQLYFEVELPLAEVLAEMEYHGFRIDEKKLEEFSNLLGQRILALEKEIYHLAGEVFNINSPKQLGVILFEKLGLPSVKKNKTGYSTSAEVLEELAGTHDIISMILEYRQFTKLKSTYADGLRTVINQDTGKIHSSFNQTITVTGRISSTEPNLQNIPVRMEMGREIRKVFIPESDAYILTDADYSQIELRILAHITGDENMIEAFENGEDIHTATASAVFGIPQSEVTPELRGRAKAVNFGIVYGIGEFSLAKDIGITRKEAKAYIDGYLAKYTGIKKYMSDTVEKGKELGYVTTLMGRRRYLPELKSKNFNIRSFGERIAMNTPIQGTAADIIKIAMVKVYKALKDGGFQSRLILQVHDELIIETHQDEQAAIEQLLKNCMENAMELKVQLSVDVNSGNTWYNAKG